MSTRSIRLLGMGLLCSLLPATSMPADAPVAPATARLESLLIAHDVRYALQSPHPSPSDCLHTEAERGR